MSFGALRVPEFQRFSRQAPADFYIACRGLLFLTSSALRSLVDFARYKLWNFCSAYLS